MTHTKTAVIIGAGPGLGMSIASRFGAQGFRVVLISRNAARHPGYVARLEQSGIAVTARVADVTDHDRLAEVLTEIGAVDFVYYGPGPQQLPRPVVELDVDTVRTSFEWIYPAIVTTRVLLSTLRSRPGSGMIFAGGLSSVVPMPQLGQLALPAAAIRNYALTLHAALAEHNVYAGTLTIGGLVERGDIHTMVTADPDKYGAVDGHTLDPDALADAAWDMFTRRDRAERVLDVLHSGA